MTWQKTKILNFMVIDIRKTESQSSSSGKNEKKKGSRRWIVGKKSYKNVKMRQENLIRWSKYMWNIEKWILRKITSLIF